MENFDFVIFEIIPVIFLLLIFLAWRIRNKTGKGMGNNRGDANPPFNPPAKNSAELKVIQSRESYTFCPYCNTKVMKSSARHCHICHTRTICPKCRKCVNKEQHRGI